MLRKTRRYFIVLNKGNDIIKEIGPFCDHIEAEDARYRLHKWFGKYIDENEARINQAMIARDKIEIVCEETQICIDCIKSHDMDLIQYGYLLISD